MPASSSSPIHPVLGHLADLADDAGEDSRRLLAVLARVADPRHRRGVRHRLAVILGLAVIEIAGAVITADALHAQRDHATYLAGRGAHCLLIIKRNQPGLYAQLASLPWRDVPVAYQARERGHDRTERRTPPLPRPAAQPPPPDDHGVLNDFAGP
jgi:hypothetical protein